MGLNATVTPGLTVSETTVLTAANLSLLGTPTVSITGSIDASDIGANTVGSSELQDNAVKEQHIGSIGGTNYILRGDASGNGQGITTLAQEGDETQISLLVNDKTNLGARYITGAIEATTPDSNKLNLAIAEDSISAAMLQDSALTRKVSIKDIQPGGGLSGRDGVASTSSSAVTGGLIVFDPSSTESQINGTNYFGTPKVLQPTGNNQYLKSDGTKGGLVFGSIGQQADAYVSAYTTSLVDDGEASTTAFTTLINYNTNSLKFNGTRGRVRVYFPEDFYSAGNIIQVMGYGIDDGDKNSHFLIAAVMGAVATETVGEQTLPYVDVGFIYAKNYEGAPDQAPASILYNPNMINLHFYS
ncbi:hypothetical protein N8555_01155 [bacterium]|nr:hypothetical protein [bacterium]